MAFWLIFLLFSTRIESDFRPENFVWENRIIIYSGKGDFSCWLSETKKQDLADRKLLYFHFEAGKLSNSNYEGTIDAESFLKKLGKEKNFDEKWVLIGLDGGVKESDDDTPVPEEIFKIIDAMPMRQLEIRRRD